MIERAFARQGEGKAAQKYVLKGQPRKRSKNTKPSRPTQKTRFYLGGRSYLKEADEQAIMYFKVADLYVERISIFRPFHLQKGPLPSILR
jgi:hypothetical protein